MKHFLIGFGTILGVILIIIHAMVSIVLITDYFGDIGGLIGLIIIASVVGGLVYWWLVR